MIGSQSGRRGGMRPAGIVVLVLLALSALPHPASAAGAAQPAPPPAAPPSSAPAAPPVLQPPSVAAKRQAAAPAAQLAADQAALNQLSTQVATVSNDSRLAAMSAQAAAIEAHAQRLAAAPAAEVAGLDAKLAKILPRGRRAPSAAERKKAAPLVAQRAAVEAEFAAAQRVAEAARSTFGQIAERRRQSFSARVLTRSASPLAPTFWTSLASDIDDDAGRLRAVASEALATALAAPEPRGAIALLAALAAAVAIAFPIRAWLTGLGHKRLAGGRTGVARMARSLWAAVVLVLAPMLAVLVVRLVAEWSGLLSPAASSLAGAAVTATAWAAGISGLGRVLAASPQADLRVLEVTDEDARRLRTPLLIVALITGAGFVLRRLNYVIGASLSATIAVNCFISVAYAAAAGLLLVSFGRGRSIAAEPATQAEGRRASIWTLISLALSAAILVTLVAVLAGYTTLAALTSSQIFWLSIIAATAYLVMRFADELTTALFGPKGWAARTLFLLFRFRSSTIAQVGALVGAAVQILVLIGALSLALTPFGPGGALLVGRLAELGAPIRIGSATISPGAVAAGIATFIVGMGAARVVQGWVVRRYLPVTDWDAGVRNSVTTGVGYLGVAVALACALAASGLGMGQIALIASALSVGIGFGLQTIVQNFVSGVILLVERPVKVGDWVSVDGVEGDIRRIRVRATEIVTQDRTTVIVPNSDLVTKQVANKMLSERCARVDVRLSVSAPADVPRAQALILGVIGRCNASAGAREPEIYVDSLTGAGAVNLSCYFYVEQPQLAYKARSDCYLEILRVLQDNKIAFAGPA